MTAEDRIFDRTAGRLERTRDGEALGILGTPHLRMPSRVLDRFMGSFRPGTVTLLDSAHPYVFEMIGMICAQTVGPLCGDVLYIDGGNRFDPYSMMAHARRLGVDRALVLDNVKVARAFTAHQMTTLMYDMLGKELERRSKEAPGRPMTVVVGDIMDLYHDEEVKGKEAKGMLEHCSRRLVEVTERYSCVTVVTSFGLSKTGTRPSLRKMVYDMFHRVVRIERSARDTSPVPRRYHPVLNRSRRGHPRMFMTIPAEGKAMYFHPTPRFQLTLDDYADLGV